MEIRAINPQTWLGAFHINQAIEVKSGQRVLYVAGQTSNDAKGAPLHAGDIVAQTRQAWANLVEVLEVAAINPVALAAYDKVLLTVGAVKILEERLQ